jgi:ABC-type Fe3+/spermidine/putrescine transport system ATPase subunit
MDEPFSSLDSEIREEMQELVKRMHQEYKTTIVFVTHDRDEAFLLANRIGVMQNGKILQVGKPQELYEHPVHHQVALLLGAKNVWQGELRNGYFYSGDAHIQLHDGYGETKQTGWLILRPEIFRVVQENGNVTKDDRMIEGTIKQLSFRQGFYYIQVHIGSHTLLVIEKPERDMRLFPGQPVRLAYDRNKIQFLPDVPERKE